jgi:hypothetical protein
MLQFPHTKHLSFFDSGKEFDQAKGGKAPFPGK